MWFPMPDSTADVVPFDTSDATLSASELLSLLLDSAAEEWRHKVGVAGASDGSAKSSTRLLLSGDWVLKTDLLLCADSPEAIRSGVEELLDLAAQTRLWHPSKVWLALRSGGTWYRASACRRLKTLREIRDRKARFAYWLDMLEMAISIAAAHGIGLDINPSNFALSPEGAENSRLYYIDDEYFVEAQIEALGEAVVGRIPEEIDSTADDWTGFAAQLYPLLRRVCKRPDEWDRLTDAIKHYPLVERFTDNRNALLDSLRASRKTERAKRKVAKAAPPADPRLTCVFADVHGNLTALDAVIADAREAGADSYLFLGDAVGYGPRPGECIQRLAELPNLTAIRGNHDHALVCGAVHDGMNSLAKKTARWTAEQVDDHARAWLAALPIEHKTASWMAVHGAPRDPNRFWAYVYEMTYRENLESLEQNGVSVCFYGHTHIPFVHRRVAKQAEESLGAESIELGRPRELALVNPGSVGQPRDGDARASYALWDRVENRISFRRTAYNVGTTVRDLLSHGLPSALAARLQEGR
jgi:predicted phosphodiesterase